MTMHAMSRLIRVYQGERIAVCCAGCEEEWDGLSRVQKVAKLAAAMPQTR